METFNAVLSAINGVIWHDYVLIFIMGVGVLFTLWSGFCQYRALTHGVQVIRGKYDDKSDPGAISHFQALSAALSATVGLGNIAGVALAIALGGPGAVFWMWMIGLFGMALKTTEVSLAMLYRKTDDPENPHGGAMWVADTGFGEMGSTWAKVGKIVGSIFCVTLLISAVTGGNMFQAWNVAEITHYSFKVPRLTSGLVLATLAALVILGGIKRIGSVAGMLVPFMCVVYLIAALYVVVLQVHELPGLFRLIFQGAFGRLSAERAFVGGTMGYAFLWGLKRALFSSESGQGSAPIAHSAAKTDEPIREGVVAGLEPFIDTIVVCTLTALVILSSGAWNREAEGYFTQANAPQVVPAKDDAGNVLPSKVLNGQARTKWTLEAKADAPMPARLKMKWNEEVVLKENEKIFVLARSDDSEQTADNLYKITGKVSLNKDTDKLIIKWDGTEDYLNKEPTLVAEMNEKGETVYPMYVDYAGSALTGHAFDRVQPGLGRWMIPIAAWLFALSTVISWSYYGEQGSIYLFGERSVFYYRFTYCAFIVIATLGFITTDTELDNLTALGTGVMLVANIPICLIFGRQTMRAYHDYLGKLRRGEFDQDNGKGNESVT